MSENLPMVRVLLGQLEQTCFIMMPLRALFQAEYESVIRPAVEEMGLSCVRGDEIYSKPTIVDDIWRSIRSSRLVIAELTGKNPNVFYEVGLAQAIGKPVIILTRDEADVPFDLKALRYLYYDVQNPFWGEHLKSQLKTMIENVLNEPGLSTYLEDITVIEALEFPKPKPSETTLDEKKEPELPNLTGIWHRSSYELPDRGVSSAEKILNLSQKGKNLTASEIITYFLGSTPTVVQQSLSGTIVGKKVTLSGVNYTFIQRGGSDSYLLDNYELELSEDFTQMTGKSHDEEGAVPYIIYTRAVENLS